MGQEQTTTYMFCDMKNHEGKNPTMGTFPEQFSSQSQLLLVLITQVNFGGPGRC